MTKANELKSALAAARDAIMSATTKRTEDRRRQETLVATALAKGSTKKAIAEAAGVSRTWFYKADLAPNTPAVGKPPTPATEDQQQTLNELQALRAEIERTDSVLMDERARRDDLVRDLVKDHEVSAEELIAASGLSAESLRGILGGKLKKRLTGRIHHHG